MKVLEFEIEAVTGGTRVSARPPGRPSRAELREVDLAAVANDVHGRMARSVPPIDVFEATMVEAERSAGHLLGELLGASLPDAILDQSERGEVILAVHARGPIARGLPWELLRFGAGEPAEEVRGRAAVVRVADVGGASPPEPAEGLEVALWCPDPDNELCAGVVSELQATLSVLGIPCVSPRKPVAPRHRRIVHVVAHGARSDALFGVVRAGSVGARAVPAILASLGPVTGEDGVAGVVLDVCGAGAAWREGADHLPRALLAAGCPAVRSPQAALSARAAVAANERFYDALVGGRSLAWATRAARQAVCSLGLGRPDSRWHQLRLLVGQVDAHSLGRPVRQRAETAALWPGASTAVVSVLERATRLAWQRRTRRLTPLLLAQAIVELAAPGAQVALEMLVYNFDPRLLQRQAWRVEPGWEALPLSLSPRLERWARELADAVTVDALAERLGALERGPLHARFMSVPVPTDSLATLDFQGVRAARPERAGRPVLEVLGGPEDGRILRVEPGASVGRFAPEKHVDHALYADCGGHDAMLSRRHLLVRDWCGHALPSGGSVGTIEVVGRSPARRLGPEVSVAEAIARRAPVSVGPGDLVLLTEDTWLRVWLEP